MDFGQCEGLTAKEIHNKYPEVVRQWEASTDLSYPGGESVVQLYQRVSEALDEIVAENKNTLIIAHNGVIRAIHQYFLGGDFNQYDAKNGEIFKFKEAPS